MNISNKSFAQLFCESYGIPAEEFENAVLRKTLYPHARFFLLPLRGWLDSDREILNDVGREKDLAGIMAVLSRLPWYYGQRWNFRNSFLLRVSSRRILAIACEYVAARSKKRVARRLIPSIR